MKQLSRALLAIAAVHPVLVFEALDASFAKSVADDESVRDSDFHGETAADYAAKFSAALGSIEVVPGSVVIMHEYYETDPIAAADLVDGGRIIAIPWQHFAIVRSGDGSVATVEIEE